MGCACRGRARDQFVWTSDDGTMTTTYNTEVEAQAKVMRRGGTYEKKVAA